MRCVTSRVKSNRWTAPISSAYFASSVCSWNKEISDARKLWRLMFDHIWDCSKRLTRFSSGTDVQHITRPAKGADRSAAPLRVTTWCEWFAPEPAIALSLIRVVVDSVQASRKRVLSRKRVIVDRQTGVCDKISKAKHLSGRKKAALMSKILSPNMAKQGHAISNRFKLLYIQKPSSWISRNLL